MMMESSQKAHTDFLKGLLESIPIPVGNVLSFDAMPFDLYSKPSV